jgi:hypothetical protein
MTRITIKFDVDKAQKLGERLGLLSGEQIAAITVPVVNQVAERTYNLAREKITTGINLSDDYLKRRFTVRKATPSNPTATITALGNPGSMTPLGRYDARMVLVPKKDPRNRGKGKLPLNGNRQRGVTVEVARSRPVTLLFAFAQPLRAGNVDGGNGLGVFVRSRYGELRHTYGPQVYQMFRTQIDNIDDQVLDDLDTTMLEEAETAIRLALV